MAPKPLAVRLVGEPTAEHARGLGQRLLVGQEPRGQALVEALGRDRGGDRLHEPGATAS